MFIYWKEFAEENLSFHTNFVMLGAPRKMISNKWKLSVKVIMTLSFLHKLIRLHNLVKAGHKHD